MGDSASSASVAPAAIPEEAAAIAAAVQLFIGQTTPIFVEAPPEDPVGPWQRAALREGVARAPDAAPFWA